MVRKLKAMFPGKNDGPLTVDSLDKEDDKLLSKGRKKKKQNTSVGKKVGLLPPIDLSNYNIQPLDDTDADVHVDDEDDADIDLDDDDDVTSSSTLTSPLHVLPLYSLLSSEKQALIWAGTPPGARLCVVATNVAETSLTIPGVKYVIDCGKVKTKHWDKVTGVSTFIVEWTSQAQANQRAGRA